MKWRRRESNEETSSPNPLVPQELTDSTLPLSAHCQHSDDANRHSVAPIDIGKEQFFSTWDKLPDHIRLALKAFCLHPIGRHQQRSGPDFLDSPVHSDLAQLLLAWGQLSEQVRAEVLSLIISKSKAHPTTLSNEGGRQ